MDRVVEMVQGSARSDTVGPVAAVGAVDKEVSEGMAGEVVLACSGRADPTMLSHSLVADAETGEVD